MNESPAVYSTICREWNDNAILRNKQHYPTHGHQIKITFLCAENNIFTSSHGVQENLPQFDSI